MTIEVNLKNGKSDTITDALGVTEDEVKDLIKDVFINDGEGLVDSLMIESQRENYGQLVFTLATFHLATINTEFKEFIEAKE